MARRFLALLGVLAVSGVLAAAQQKPQIVKGTIQRTDAGDAKEMFTTYCATCHGALGKGDGPAAVALKTTPADLTKISARNGGKFPEVRVTRFIQGVETTAAHGSRDMPIWGDLFRSLHSGDRTAAEMRARNLTEYLKSIQQ